MSTPLLLSVERRSIVLAITFAVVLFSYGAIATYAQEAYLVTAADASLNLYNLSTNNLIETITSGLSKSSVVVGPNKRLAFVSTGSSLSVIDLTIEREVRRIQGLFISPGSMTFTPDGKWLLFADEAGSGYTYTLDVFDPVRMELVRRVPLAPVLGYGADSPLGSIVVVGEKAYVTPAYTDQSRPAIAVVDLRSFRARRITIPAGYFDGQYLGTLPNAAATSDGKYVVMVETESSDGSYHVFLISTMSDSFVTDNVLNDDPYGIVVSPVISPAYGYVVLGSSAVVLDLNNGSSTFGQLLSQTEVDFSQYFLDYGVAINAEGSRLVVSGFKSSSQGPQPNVVVIDTSLMLTNPSQAIIANTTVANGAQTNGVTIATVTTASPPTAPTVTGVSGSVTNDTPTIIHVSGTNFAAGALVRIGGMAPLNATVNSSTDLQITVPVNAPAAPGLDVIVTNPSVLSSPAHQNQSGLLAGGLTIHATSAFNTTYQFAALNSADGSVSVFDSTQRAMVNVPLAPPGIASLTFNADGEDLYSASRGPRYHPNIAEAVALNLGTDSLTPITVQGNRPGAYQALVPAINPPTGGSVVYEWTSANNFSDITVSMVDTNPSSPTFNTVLETLNAGLSGSEYFAYAGTATPDGTFVYVNYVDLNSGQLFIAIFDVVHGGPATIISNSSLGIYPYELFDMYVTPDGKSLLLQTPYDGLLGLGIGVFDISANPKNPTLVTTITGTSPSHVGGAGPMFIFSYQVVGNRLFAFDYDNDLLLAFNFDRQHGNYSQLGAYRWQGVGSGNAYIAVSPDGNLIYIGFGGNDMISVYDVSKLVTGQSALITNLASFHGPSVMAVSPVSGSDLLRRGPRATSGGVLPARPQPANDEEKNEAQF